MTILEFPPHESADDDGFLAVGGDLEIDSLLLAYRSGIFPWPFDERTLAWFSPPERAVLFFSEFHISHSLKKARRKSACRFTINEAFDQVILHCAELKNRKRQRGTWITPSMISAYKEMHRQGYAHSFECWDGPELVGGIYGVSIGSAFAGESMFYRQDNASKLALWFLVEELGKRGIEWMDCQVLNPLTESVGAREIPRGEFLKLLESAVNRLPPRQIS